MKYIRHTLKLFVLSSIALTGIMCSEKSNTESDADTYFATHFQDDKGVCAGNEAALEACRLERNACAFPTGKYKDSYTDEELDHFNACYEQYRSCAAGLYSCYGPLKTLKAFVLDTLTDGKELGEISPELAWDGTANMGGVAMADKRCQALADKNQISGQFKAFLSSSKRDFYKVINPKYLDLPFENVHGTVLSGTTVLTLDDLRIKEIGVYDGKWDSVMFFRANGQRIEGCNFISNVTYDVFTGMNEDGKYISNTCKDWTSNIGIRDSGFVTAIFDKGASASPIEPVTGTSWKNCMQGDWSHFNVLKVAEIKTNYCSSFRADGLFCVQVEK